MDIIIGIDKDGKFYAFTNWGGARWFVKEYPKLQIVLQDTTLHVRDINAAGG